MLTIITHPDCALHDNGPDHPEKAGRLDAISDHLIMSGLDFSARFEDAPAATVAQLIRAHDPDYVDSVLSMAGCDGTFAIDDETSVSAKSVPAALRAAGAGILGVDLTMTGTGQRVFCNVRPPGHHAERAGGMGFSIFNNVAVAAYHALDEYGLDRVAIVDFDAHHGNGIENIFKDETRVLYCSTFQHPFYPFTGEPSNTETLVNAPLAAGTGRAAFREVITAQWLPALDRFRPQLLVVAAGFDGHGLDDMSNLELNEADFAWVTERLVEVANEHAAGRIVSILEGGYELGALARSVVQHLKAMLDAGARP